MQLNSGGVDVLVPSGRTAYSSEKLSHKFFETEVGKGTSIVYYSLGLYTFDFVF